MNLFTWIKELHRRLKPGGIIFLTSYDNDSIGKLTETEKIIFQKGELVKRGITIN